MSLEAFRGRGAGSMLSRCRSFLRLPVAWYFRKNQSCVERKRALTQAPAQEKEKLPLSSKFRILFFSLEKHAM